MQRSAVCFVYPTRSVFVSLVFVQFEPLQQSRERLVSWGGGTCLPGSLPKIFVTRQQLGPSHNSSVLLTPLLAPPCRCITSFSNFPAPQIKIRRSFIKLCTFSKKTNNQCEVDSYFFCFIVLNLYCMNFVEFTLWAWTAMFAQTHGVAKSRNICC